MTKIVRFPIDEVTGLPYRQSPAETAMFLRDAHMRDRAKELADQFMTGLVTVDELYGALHAMVTACPIKSVLR